MPITRSAQKALRQSLRRRVQNLKRKEAYKSAIKNIRKLAVGQKIEEARQLLPQLYKNLDKAAKTHAIHKNKASRLKSRLTKLVGKKSV